jgi:Ca2+-binding EF-hand superfamily protein
VLVSDAFRTWSYIEKGIINGTVGINELRDAIRKQYLPQILTPTVIEQFIKVIKSSTVSFPEFLNMIVW